jgi:hypothetical protein
MTEGGECRPLPSPPSPPAASPRSPPRSPPAPPQVGSWFALSSFSQLMSRLSPRFAISSRVNFRKRPSSPWSLRLLLPAGRPQRPSRSRRSARASAACACRTRGHVGAHVVEPDGLRVALVGLAAGEEEHVRLHALRVEDARSAGAGWCADRTCPSGRARTSAPTPPRTARCRAAPPRRGRRA